MKTKQNSINKRSHSQSTGVVLGVVRTLIHLDDQLLMRLYCVVVKLILFYSLTQCSSSNVAQRGWPLLPIHILSPSIFNPSPSISNCFIHLLLYPIFPSYNCPSSSPRNHTSLFTKFLFIHAFIALTLPSCYAACLSQITHFHSMHSWLLCSIPCPSLRSIHQCWQENTVS